MRHLNSLLNWFQGLEWETQLTILFAGLLILAIIVGLINCRKWDRIIKNIERDKDWVEKRYGRLKK